ncbi:MAG TPA: lactonase family protein, partial [Anaerolineaceae bacterium]|nr:lactonase family protein [Anaerolineaceae bacterium]
NLKFINHQPSQGTDPCHLTVDQSGRFVLVANFMSGSVCVLPINADGSLGHYSDFIQHHGSSIDPIRQKSPHAHAVTLDNNGQYAFVPDLGLDRLMNYRFDPTNGKLEPNAEPWIDITAGSGPRQLVLDSKNEYAYLINELNSTVMVFQYEGQAGRLRKIQTVSTLPEEFDGASTCAEIQISPSGKFLYGSNRGHDSIVVFAIDQNDGKLSYVGHKSTQGKSPRHFIIDPDGLFLLVANQDTDNVVVFRVDPISGKLSDTGHATHVPTPVCIKILPGTLSATKTSAYTD